MLLAPQAVAGKPKKKLLDQVRDVMRLKHYSLRTERTYCDWIARFIRFHQMRHPGEMREAEMSEFLTHLARSENVSASTQNQALSALLFLYKEVLKQEIGWLQNVERAKKSARLPIVLTRDEVHKLFSHLRGTARLMAGLLYGSGLRLMECVRLRVKDIDFGYAHITVRDTKSGRDRVTPLPVNLAAPLQLHLSKVKLQHEQDLADGFGEVWLPDALARKYPRAAREWSWQFVFPSSRIKLPHFKALLRNASAGKRLRYPHGAGVVRPQGREHDDDLYPRAESTGNRSKESAGLKFATAGRVRQHARRARYLTPARRRERRERNARDYARTGTLAVRSSLPQLTHAPLIARRMAFQMQ